MQAHSPLPVQPAKSVSTRNSRPLLFILLTVSVLFFASYLGRLRELSALEQMITIAQNKIELAKDQQQSLLEENTRREGLDRIDEVARRDLDLVQFGDQAFAVLDPEVPTTPTQLQLLLPEDVAKSVTPVWKQWQQLFFPKE